MGQTLILDIPEFVYEALADRAKQQGRSPEDLAESILNKEIERSESSATFADHPNPYPLRGTPIRYVDPMEPVAVDEWDALK